MDLTILQLPWLFLGSISAFVVKYLEEVHGVCVPIANSSPFFLLLAGISSNRAQLGKACLLKDKRPWVLI